MWSLDESVLDAAWVETSDGPGEKAKKEVALNRSRRIFRTADRSHPEVGFFATGLRHTTFRRHLDRAFRIRACRLSDERASRPRACRRSDDGPCRRSDG